MTDSNQLDVAADRQIVIIADFLPPDFGAVGQYMMLRAREFAERGHSVELFGLSTIDATIEHHTINSGSLAIHRLRARPVPRGSLIARMMWTAITNLRLLNRAFSKLRAANVILFTGSPPFLIHFLLPLRWLLRGRLVYRITDFYPECLIATRNRPSIALKLLQRLTNFWRRRVDVFEVLGEDQRRRLLDQGIGADLIALVRDTSPIQLRQANPHLVRN